jgi:diguanylate cyclase (GGDEF)-like protein
LVAAVAVVIIGLAGSIVASRSEANNSALRSRQAFLATSADVASTLDLAILHEQDLALGVSGFFVGSLDAPTSGFDTWVDSIGAFGRYPELMGIGEIELVPGAQLAAFDAGHTSATGAGGGPARPPGAFPAGQRPQYCMLNVWTSRGPLPFPSNLDFCDTSIGTTLMSIAQSGQVGYAALEIGPVVDLAVGSPIYSTGLVPPSMSSRRAALVGWTGAIVEPSVFMASTLRTYPHTRAVLQYEGGAGHATFTAGAVSGTNQSTTIDLHHGWRVIVFGSVTDGGVFASTSALVLLGGGILLSIVLGLLVYILGTSRSRAMSLVDVRTDQLRHQALHDSLTGLPNRVLILDRIDSMLARTRRQMTAAAVLFIDLDNFKVINDTHGHNAGDRLLVDVAARLKTAVRQGDTVGRLSGDEFVVLTEGGHGTQGATLLAERILAVLAPPFDLPGSETGLSVSASIGIAEGDRETPEELLRDADIALYQAKSDGKGRAVLFSSAMFDAVQDTRSLEVDLHESAEAQHFFLEYQLTVDLATGSFTGVEALLRWRHPRRGIIQPDTFIPTLESTGLIVPVGTWVLGEACRQGAEWNRAGISVSMSVNVSARQLERERIVDDVHDALSASGFDPGQLTLELTETTLMRDVGSTVAVLRSLKALGVRIAIDDFGIGYSSLAYLRQFPIDVLKIDRSFVAGLADSSESAAVIHTLVQLGKVLGLETIAEGIEDEHQRLWLAGEQVDTGQGYLFARPGSAEDVGRRLAEGLRVSVSPAGS